MSRLWHTNTHTDGHGKVGQYPVWAESAKTILLDIVQIGATTCPNWFWHFFKMKKNAQIACRGKGNLDNAQKWGLCISMATFWKISLQFSWHVMKTLNFYKHVFEKVENILVFFQSMFYESGRHCDLMNIFWKPFRRRKDHIFFLKMICMSAHYWTPKEDRMFTTQTIKAILLYFVSFRYKLLQDGWVTSVHWCENISNLNSSKYQSLQIALFVFIYLL